MVSRKQTRQIGAHYKKGGSDVTAGTPVDFQSKPVDAKTNTRHTQKVFQPINAGQPKVPNGDRITMTINVLGGQCGREKMCTDLDVPDEGEHAADSNLTQVCQAVRLIPAEMTVPEPFNF